MKLTAISLFALATEAARGQCARGPGCNPLTVRTATGTYTGMIDPEFPNTRQWRSIPFAEPPVASRRWLPPQKLTSSPDEHHYSVKYPASCPQFISGVPSFWNANYTQGNLIYNGAQNDTSGLAGEATSEDCLQLAVWTPTTEPPEGGFPVMFFMTGGGFILGGVELPWQIPTSWVERSQSHIVVSVNYRVSIFGFPNARGLEEQNLGFLDQRIALEWVHENIAAFGGNPSRITQWGRSAGAVSTDIHAYAWHEDPIAQAYYMESGTAFGSNRIPEPAYSNFSFVAANVGCASPCGPGCEDEDGKAELDCMRQVSMTQIVNFVGQYADRGETPLLDFRLVVDDKIVFADYHARSEAGKIARVPTMISVTANEFSVAAPWPVEPDYVPDQEFFDQGTMFYMACPALNATAYRNRLDTEVPVFRIQYAAEFPNLNVWDWQGAYHNSETPLIFGTYELLDHIAPSTEYQRQVSESMQDHILAFVKDPYNGPQEMGWQPMVVSEPNGGQILRFGGSSGKVFEFVDGIDVDGACLGIGKYEPFP
ncbi:acetylcholinesterase [Stachybotrys elegans]|uniref:Acetylcholinesterase n=1 Tax=Stachybotrys elegans TaxID=80388 RepID=A0A8K0SY84_9HYPO|nr:acetylcholinesterase [Stachybotrys elegans]